ncbi:MAG TPA: preprotein translocase subunit YajC [Gemmata sp.]|jgi:preprotein translocase subunit YajC|nr:preprotein translocase subunit YajC [Gemmata sp.]
MGRMMTQLLLGQQPQGDGGGGGGLGGPMALPFIMIVGVLLFAMVVLPANRRQRKEQEKLLATLKRGTKILTSGGIVAVIVSAKDGEDEILIRSEDTKLRIKRTGVLQILGSDEAEANKS